MKSKKAPVKVTKWGEPSVVLRINLKHRRSICVKLTCSKTRQFTTIKTMIKTILVMLAFGSGAYGQGLNLSAYTACSNTPAEITKVLQEMQDFSKSCPQARLEPGKMIMINDYSGKTMPPVGYVFDQSGKCVQSMPITWGVGSDNSGKMEACSTKDTLKTPPGAHKTVAHTGGPSGKYNQSNSLGLAGLSGQKSDSLRGILIHAAEQPGTASSWGCTGVPAEYFANLQQKLGTGSLVYNYFGENPTKNCSDDAGFERPPKCDPEASAGGSNTAATPSGSRQNTNNRNGNQ